MRANNISNLVKISLISTCLFYCLLLVGVVFLNLIGDANSDHTIILMYATIFVYLQYITEEFQIFLIRIIYSLFYVSNSIVIAIVNTPLNLLEIVYRYFNGVPIKKKKSKLKIAMQASKSAGTTIDEYCFNSIEVIRNFSLNKFITKASILFFAVCSGFTLFLLLTNNFPLEYYPYLLSGFTLLILVNMWLGALVIAIEYVAVMIKIAVLFLVYIGAVTIDSCYWVIDIAYVLLKRKFVFNVVKVNKKTDRNKCTVYSGEDYELFNHSYFFKLILWMLNNTEEELQKITLDMMKSVDVVKYMKIVNDTILLSIAFHGMIASFRDKVEIYTEQIKAYLVKK